MKTSNGQENTFDKKRVLFLTLTTFIQAGGIERFNRCFLKALSEIEEEGGPGSHAFSAYDTAGDEQYYPLAAYRGFGGARGRFFLQALKAARYHEQIILGHINLAPLGYLIKKLFPSKRLILVTHGIEVWQPMRGLKKKVLHLADTILSVSQFTKDKLTALHKVPSSRITIFPNTIDPFFPFPVIAKNITLRREFNIHSQDPVLFTLSRLATSEKYKGYDIVLQCIPELKKRFPGIKYIIAGKYDQLEKQRIDALVDRLDLQSNVILTGYLSEESLIAYYQAADIFIMPSQKEGFGIVFLEAMICGLPVIAGNMDGSVDALRNGELGTLVDPTDVRSVLQGIEAVIESNKTRTTEHALDIRKKAIAYFGFERYKERLEAILSAAHAGQIPAKKLNIA